MSSYHMLLHPLVIPLQVSESSVDHEEAACRYFGQSSLVTLAR